jgi:DNA-binding CsgD family transcriptional regulator
MRQGFQALSEREKETLRLLLGGHDIKSIAGRLGLSVHTVNERLREARRKLGASSSRQAARLLADLERRGPGADPEFSADNKSGVAGGAVQAGQDGPPYRRPGRGQSLAWFGGGMLVMSLIIAAAVLSAALSGSGGTTAAPLTRIVPAAASPAAADAPAAAGARQWLALVDAGRWDEAWRTAGALFRSGVSAAQFASKVEPLRRQLGPVSSRMLQTADKAESPRGAPPGEYEILEFATAFAHKPGAVERVVLVHEGAGWKVDGYFIR